MVFVQGVASLKNNVHAQPTLLTIIAMTAPAELEKIVALAEVGEVLL